MEGDARMPQVLGPYPGLRAFQRAEAEIFFGREEQIDDLLEHLHSARLLAVAGESGCGKSSLVRAGLIPALEGGFLPDAGAHWRIADMRPGNQPIANLARVLLGALRPAGEPPSAEDEALMAAQLRSGPAGVIELLAREPLPPDTELLLLVDQFEELIRYRGDTDGHEADAFVALLLETAASALPVRIVLTLRTDYLGKCAVFRGLPEALNRSQYLTPLLSREQLSDVIVYPARMFDGDIEPVLANHIINEIGNEHDQLPVIQHLLMWMWTRVQATPGRPPPIALSMGDYEQVGGIATALANHADEVYGGLGTPERQRIARKLFCALWKDDTKSKDNRRPCSVREAAAIAGVSESELIAVADEFRAAKHSFLMPPRSEPLRPASMLDVSHESLFRHWGTLGKWISDEMKDVEEYRTLRARAAKWQKKHGDPLSATDLQAAREFSARVTPTASWAIRHGSSERELHLVDDFVAASAVDVTASERARRNANILWLVLGLFALTALSVAILATIRHHEEEQQRAEREQRHQLERYAAAAWHVV
ncbi:MAG TPA: ATP-binding protein, partial [Polyangiales bacterium]|nr:ATP-binding protein [Polyangiales bacterium]